MKLSFIKSQIVLFKSRTKSYVISLYDCLYSNKLSSHTSFIALKLGLKYSDQLSLGQYLNINSLTNYSFARILHIFGEYKQWRS